MSFTFNFAAPENDGDENESTKTNSLCLDGQEKESDNGKETVSLAREMTSFCCRDVISKFDTVKIEFGQHCLRIIDTSKMEKYIKENKNLQSYANSQNLACALTSNSDLVTGVYEGGLKLWECGIDLAEFLSSHPTGQAIAIKGKCVLELGCGAGLPGIYCLKCEAQTVDFQDFNEEVLQLLTHANATINGEGKKSRYFFGDWSSLSSILQKEMLRYDVILSAETIYNPDNYASLHQVFDTALSDKGIIVISAKVYYFGVGGSVDAFVEFVESKKVFSTETVHAIQTGVPRKIIVLRRCVDR